jgi:hypothetical protein
MPRYAMLALLLALMITAGCPAAPPPPTSPSGPPVTLHVSLAGRDTWSGLQIRPNAAKTDGPLASPAAARDALRQLRAAGKAGRATIIFLPGDYRLFAPLVLQPADSFVTWKSLPGAEATISGGQVVTGWRQDAPGLWSAPAAGLTNQRLLFVNGRRATLARSPNEGYYRMAGKAAPLVGPDGKEQDSSKRAFRFKPGDLQSWPDVAGGNVIVFYHWETGILRLKSVDEASTTAVLTGEMKWPFWSNQRYYVENVRAALDAPGEWFCDQAAGRLLYRPLPGEDMRKAEVVAPRLTQLVLLQGDTQAGLPVENVRFENLSFQHTNYELEPEGHSDWQAAVTINAAIQANGARGCVIDNCEIARLGNYAVWFENACQRNTVSHCDIHNCSAGGVRIGRAGVPPPLLETDFNTVSDNFIHDLGIDFYGAVGVWIGHASDNVIAHNEVCDLNYTAVSCGWSWGYGNTKHHRNRIEYNHLHDVGRGKLCDMGAIYTLGISPGTVLRHNLIHDVWDWEEGYGAGGIYPDEGSSQILIENNVVYRTATGGLTVHYGKDNTARNNIFAFGRDLQVYLGRRDKDSSLTFDHNIVYYDEGALFQRESDLTADYNIYFDTRGEPLEFPVGLDFAAWQAKGLDVHSQITDPKFVDAAQYDFRLKPDSPALKLGFQPIDVTQAGITEPPELIKLARSIKREPFSTRRAQAPALSLDEGFETTPVNSTADLAYTHGETTAASIRVTDEMAAAGKRSLRFTDAPGLDQTWNPHIFYSPNQNEGLATCSFDLRLEPGADVWHEWRDNASPYRVGPSLGINAAGKLKAANQELIVIPRSQWVHFEIVSGLGKKAEGTWSLTVTVAGQAPRRFEKLPCNPKWNRLQWMSFVSNATERTVFYLDNLRLNVAK